MRPVRLLLDGFGSYREPAEADFSDVDFFALVGPTGSGKSTVIDGLCFALYGTVPRWGKENVIAQALAPAANACRVALVFDAAGKRYAAVRALTRNARGQVNTKEARLELLDPSVHAGAPLTELLESSIEAVAEGPEQVKAAVQGILGLTYEHFTQSVLLPQGRFSEFLRARAADRQNLLVELLAFGVYETVGQKARERAKLAGELAARAKDALAELARAGGATEEAEEAARSRVAALAELAAETAELLGSMREHADRAREAEAQGQAVRAEVDLLAAVRTPAGVLGLAKRIADAAALVSRRRAERDRADQAEAEASAARDGLPAAAALERLRDAYGQRRELLAVRARQEKVLAERQAELKACEGVLAGAELKSAGAQAAYAAAERSHAALAVAQDLRVGEDCPVCLQPVAALPHQVVPADVAEARAAVDWAAEAVKEARSARDGASRETAFAAAALDNTAKQLEKVAAVLADASGEAEVRSLLEAIAVADDRMARARGLVRSARSGLEAADKERAGLDKEERAARAALSAVRDSVVGLGAPSVEGADLVAAWDALTGWSKEQHVARQARLTEVREAYRLATEQRGKLEARLRGLLAKHCVEVPGAIAQAEKVVAASQERARHQLDQVRASRRKAAELEAQRAAHAEDEKVAGLLGRLLRASSFERWLCGEALDSLVAEASETLMELSGGQYQLDRDERNDLFVIDYADAGARRPVHTLSGGETFQASLALALALSRQVIGLSAGMRDLNSMFLDEGFGTLDEDTLEIVGSTLERLSADSERMIGIITHVPALAERAPVRFVVSRAGMTSTLRKEGVT
ncbi:MAG TPA: SMC family ATPase [Streptosporangiaceae bacterium]|nr:SMC family ATPase [Streptosporangiaceae bacterium]